MTNQLFEKHKDLLYKSIKALAERTFYTPYPEHPKAYSNEKNEEGKSDFSKKLNQNYEGLSKNNKTWIGEEVSPFWQTGLGIQYPKEKPEEIIKNASMACDNWRKTSLEMRAGILIESLERIEKRFFELAYATMHTTGQSFMMAFQASGPHANDRALEAIALGFKEISQYPSELTWKKPLGKFDLTLKKSFKAIPKGIGLVIGCSTFPTWNSVPGLYANLICGNAAIVKPHPKAIFPIAIVLEEIRNVLKENKLSEDIVQLAADSVQEPVAKILAESPEIAIIDYTGGSSFGEYIEGLNKTCFTEKSGVNCVLLESTKSIAETCQNIAFSACLYSGQMCTAPQNIFIPEEGIKTEEGIIDYKTVLATLSDSLNNLIHHPKMGAGTLGAIQNDHTLKNIHAQGNFGGKVILNHQEIQNQEFNAARVASPKLVELEAENINIEKEYFGPIVFVIKCKTRHQALQKMKNIAHKKGAITCAAYSTDKTFSAEIEEEMNRVFTPVSFNFTGAAFVNQHAAFSDFHVSGGNPAGNASFTDANFICKRFVWVGNRYAPET